MNVEMPELLLGAFRTLMEPPGEEAGPAFAAGAIGVAGILTLLGAQEMENGVAMRVAENRDLRQLMARAGAEGWPGVEGAELRRLATGEDADLSLSALDAANAPLRRALIALQVAAEDAPGSTGREREGAILAVLTRAARARQVTMPQQPQP